MIFKFSKNNKNDDNLINIASLLVHAAKIDEKYTNDEKIIIKKTLLNLGVKENEVDNILDKAEENEKNSNQIIEFTKEIKKMSENEKKKIVESLWSIIYSDKKSDIYESNLMRRITGLLYLDSKTVGDIKKNIKNKNINL